jgi:hypothetical protein
MGDRGGPWWDITGRPDEAGGRPAVARAPRRSAGPDSIRSLEGLGVGREAGSVERHWQEPPPDLGAVGLAAVAAEGPRGPSVLTTGGVTFSGVGVSQQQPSAGWVTQQHPLRIIAAARPGPEGSAEAPRVADSIPTIAARAIQGRRQGRGSVMGTPAWGKQKSHTSNDNYGPRQRKVRLSGGGL